MQLLTNFFMTEHKSRVECCCTEVVESSFQKNLINEIYNFAVGVNKRHEYENKFRLLHVLLETNVIVSLLHSNFNKNLINAQFHVIQMFA